MRFDNYESPVTTAFPVDLTKVCPDTAACSNPEDDPAAFGGSTSLTVSQILAYAAGKSNAGGSTWYGNVKTPQVQAKDVFSALNQQLEAAP